MRVRVEPGGRLGGSTRVPGDKSIAHRWLILAATGAADVAVCSRFLLPSTFARRRRASPLLTPARLDLHSTRGPRTIRAAAEGHGSTWNVRVEGEAEPGLGALEVEGEGRDGLVEPDGAARLRELRARRCGCSTGCSPRRAVPSVLTGDASLPAGRWSGSRRRCARWGATIETADGHAPVEVARRGARTGSSCDARRPSAQVKSAVLLAGLDADGRTTVRRAGADPRPHGAGARGARAPRSSTRRGGLRARFQHEGFSATVPGDPSSAAFLVAAAALTGSALTITDVGPEPDTDPQFLDVMARMGVRTETDRPTGGAGEPVGDDPRARRHRHPAGAGRGRASSRS